MALCGDHYSNVKSCSLAHSSLSSSKVILAEKYTKQEEHNWIIFFTKWDLSLYNIPKGDFGLEQLSNKLTPFFLLDSQRDRVFLFFVFFCRVTKANSESSIPQRDKSPLTFLIPKKDFQVNIPTMCSYWKK